MERDAIRGVFQNLLSIYMVIMKGQVAVWEFRMNKDNLSEHNLIEQFKLLAKKYVFQLEKTENGYEHYQGRLSLIKKTIKSSLMKLFTLIPVPNYLEPTILGESTKDAFYCQKADSRIAGPWKDTDQVIYIPEQYRNKDLRPYQRIILDDGYHNDRTINFIYDPDGNKGKTTICMIAAITKGYIYLPFINDYEDLMGTMLCKCYNITRSPKAVLLDMPRAISKKKLKQVYAGLETIKGGYLFDKRYHFKEWYIDSPNIWVFSNKPPKQEYLSQDRWKLWRINKAYELREIDWNYFPREI